MTNTTPNIVDFVLDRITKEANDYGLFVLTGGPGERMGFVSDEDSPTGLGAMVFRLGAFTRSPGHGSYATTAVQVIGWANGTGKIERECRMIGRPDSGPEDMVGFTLFLEDLDRIIGETAQ